jgi:hypothetical protein
VNSYKFKKFPLPHEKLDEVKGIKFEQGEFKRGDETIIILDFTIYNDGFIIDSRSSTDDSDEFMKEILTRAHDEFNLTHYDEVIKRKNYLSQMFVSMDKSIELLNPKVKEISKYVSDNIIGFENVSFRLAGMSVFADQKPAPNINPAPFTIERQLGSPFPLNRYFSSAPLRTQNHWELLNMFEGILGT